MSGTGGADGKSVCVAFRVHLRHGRAGHRRMCEGRAPGRPGAGGGAPVAAPAPPDKDVPAAAPGPPVPRVARLLALAHHFDDLLRRGAVRDCAEIARLMRVSRARVTQIMRLRCLAPEIQETVLFADADAARRLTERRLRPILAEVEWERQRRLWREAFPDARCPGDFARP